MDLIDVQMELSAAGREDLAIFVDSEFSRLQKTGRDAAKELTRLADELKQSSTVCGEWDGSEDEAKEEYEILMALAARLTPNGTKLTGG